VYLRQRGIEEKDFIIRPNSIKNIILLPSLSKLKDLIAKIYEKKNFFQNNYIIWLKRYHRFILVS